MDSSVRQRTSTPPPATWDPPFFPFAVEALPPLPPLSPAGEHLALTHKSALDSSRPKSRTEAFELELASNRRVEWLGDSVLGWFVARFIERRWPTSVSSTVSTLKQRLTSNRQFAHLGWAYGLHHSLARRYFTQDVTSLSMKTLADTFEAYIGVLYREASAAGRVDQVEDFINRLHDAAVYPSLATCATELDNEWVRHVTSYLNQSPSCPPASRALDPLPPLSTSSKRKAEPVVDWIDRRGSSAPGSVPWTSELYYGGRLLGRGAGAKRMTSRAQAVEDMWDRRTVKQMRAFVEDSISDGEE